MNAVEQKIRDETNQLLLVRIRTMAILMAVTATIQTLLGQGVFGPGLSFPDTLIVGPYYLPMVALYIAARTGQIVSARLLAFGVMTILCFLVVISFRVFRQNPEGHMFLVYAVVVLAAAILLPWGLRMQAALAGVAVIAIQLSLYLRHGELVPAHPPIAITFFVALGLSFYVAFVLENNRLTLARQRHELEKEREVAEQRRVTAEGFAEDLDAYAHAVAHDLKNPIAVIAGYADLLGLKLQGTLDDEAQDFLTRTGQGCEKMTQIINELLLLASVRKMGDVASEPLNMAKIVGEASQRLANKIDESNAEIVTPDDWPQAVGHPAWVEEVWANYMSNAIKYGGSPPRVELGAEQDGDSKVHFWVRDNGQGLNEEQVGRLFEEFSRVTPTELEGHGLGLSIVKRIVEKLGGEVRVTSKPGAGSTFGFTLPT